jgi:hypothetical protein
MKEKVKKEKEMKLKKEYEMTFKEGLRLGMRLTQAKAYIQSARDAKRLGDDTMAELYMGFAKDWNDLARNAGRRFTPIRGSRTRTICF